MSLPFNKRPGLSESRKHADD